MSISKRRIPPRPDIDNPWPWSIGEIIMTSIAVVMFVALGVACVYEFYKMWGLLHGSAS